MPKIEHRGYTDYLNRHPAENICHAFDFAKYLGRPLNKYLTINFDPASGLYGGTVFQKIRHKFRDWYNRRCKQIYGAALPPMYVYSLENPNGQVHANWVVHVPPELQNEFDKKCQRWVSKAQGNIRYYDVHSVQVDPYSDKSLAKYLIKGIDGRYIGYMHVGEYASNQGRIWGRRAGTSPSISRAARKEAGFVPKRDRNKWRQVPDNDQAVAAVA